MSSITEITITEVKVQKQNEQKNKNKEQTKSPVVQCQFEWIGTGHCVKESEKTPVSTF